MQLLSICLFSIGIYALPQWFDAIPARFHSRASSFIEYAQFHQARTISVRLPNVLPKFSDLTMTYLDSNEFPILAGILIVSSSNQGCRAMYHRTWYNSFPVKDVIESHQAEEVFNVENGYKSFKFRCRVDPYKVKIRDRGRWILTGGPMGNDIFMKIDRNERLPRHSLNAHGAFWQASCPCPGDVVHIKYGRAECINILGETPEDCLKVEPKPDLREPIFESPVMYGQHQTASTATASNVTPQIRVMTVYLTVSGNSAA